MVTSYLANRITLRRVTPSIPFSGRVEGKKQEMLASSVIFVMITLV